MTGRRQIAAYGFLSLLWLAISSSGLALDHQVVVTGSAAILNGDLAAARDQAIADARIKAVEQAVGVMVSAETVVQREILTHSVLRTKAQGLVKSYQLLDQGQDDQGLYYVKIRATVSNNLLQDELIKLLKQDTVIIIGSEDIFGHKGMGQMLETSMSGRLADLGYKRIIDYRLLATARDRPLIKSAQSGNLPAARALGIRFMADVVIVGEMSAYSPAFIHKDFYSANADGLAKVFRTRDNTMIAGSEKAQVRGFGSTQERAGTDALKNLSQALAEDIIHSLTPAQMRTLKVIFYGIPDYSSFQKYFNLLGQMRWVNGVEADSLGYNRIKTVFLVRYSENPKFLADGLGQYQELGVESYDDRLIEVKVKASTRNN